MTGTEKILRHIADKAAEESRAILEEAEGKADALISEATARASDMMEQAGAKGEQLLADARERGEAAASMKRRRATLSVKGDLITRVMTQAYEQLLSLPDDEYFAFLYAQLEKQPLGGEGFLCLNERDLARIPADFAKKAAALAKKKGGRLSLSEEPAAIDGGFLLRYGGIEENCSLAAIFDAEEDRIKDRVRAILFDE